MARWAPSQVNELPCLWRAGMLGSRQASNALWCTVVEHDVGASVQALQWYKDSGNSLGGEARLAISGLPFHPFEGHLDLALWLCAPFLPCLGGFLGSCFQSFQVVLVFSMVFKCCELPQA